MSNDMTAIQVEFPLAALLGWTNLSVDDQHPVPTVMGCPAFLPEAAASKHVIEAPKWARDWNACGPLIVRHGLSVDIDPGLSVRVTGYSPLGIRVQYFEKFAEGRSEDASVMCAIVHAVIARLTADSMLVR